MYLYLAFSIRTVGVSHHINKVCYNIETAKEAPPTKTGDLCAKVRRALAEALFLFGTNVENGALPYATSNL